MPSRSLILLFLFFFSLSCSQRFHSKAPSRSRQNNQSALQTAAEQWLGTPYLFGGSTVSGIDCSALAGAIYRDVYGIKLPRSTRQLRRMGYSIGAAYVRPGDLLFFRMKANEPLNHVGVYLGGGRFVHASASRGVVIDSLEEPFYRRHLVTARRLRH